MNEPKHPLVNLLCVALLALLAATTSTATALFSTLLASLLRSFSCGGTSRQLLKNRRKTNHNKTSRTSGQTCASTHPTHVQLELPIGRFGQILDEVVEIRR